MRRSLIVVLVTLLVSVVAVTGCRFSKVKANATVTVSGRALAANGTPLADTTVRLFKEADLGEAIVGIVLTVGSLGTICLLPGAPAVCRQAKVATTDAQGHYRFELRGSDTQGTIGTESTLNVVVASKTDGPSTTMSFKAKDATVALPDARLWNAAPRVSEGGGRIRFAWSPLPASIRDASYSAQLFDYSRNAPMWTQAASGRSADIDARVLEDSRGTVAVAARTSPGGGTGTRNVRTSYLSSRLPVSPISGAAPSRHRPCRAVAGAVNPTLVPQPTCRVTDGDLVTPARLTGANAQVVTGVVVDLGRARRVSLVVARGLAGTAQVELSSDGTVFRQVGTTNDTTAAISPPGVPIARYVRVRSPSGLDESLMAEVSVW